MQTTDTGRTQTTYKLYENKLNPLLFPERLLTGYKSSTASKQISFPGLTHP